ncbi:VWA domain-containing protein [uncultured Rhodoblastus sp.]|uniref:VWA domain-containing protein n=1 Tax=uncultured Rhodoblastus sp. TaxID=543037 RepID=UPI0025FA6752|nr:VWA domain-containing protein [uncultured Rhodoblastus sp.]
MVSEIERQGAAMAAQRQRQVENFLEKARNVPVRTISDRGRLIFALDATMSRQPSWDLAQKLQAEMFSAASGCGGLDIQLVYFRGFGECRASRFVRDGAGLAGVMSKISVRGGQTQIAKVLRHVKAEQAEGPVGAFVFIGDAMEEKPDDLARIAGELGLRGVKGFFFQEGGNAQVAACFKDLARITGGAYAAFDAGAAGRLAGLLKAAAAYAAGGFAALEARAKRGEAEAKLLLGQMK